MFSFAFLIFNYSLSIIMDAPEREAVRRSSHDGLWPPSGFKRALKRFDIQLAAPCGQQRARQYGRH